MSTLVLPMASSGVKRPLEDDSNPPREQTPGPEPAEEPGQISSEISGSPLSSISSMTSRTQDVKQPATDGMTTQATPNAKRRKLTEAEKVAAKAEKERKAQEKATLQAQREAEKQKKLEEKKQKDEEKEEKRRVKEAEKAAKDVERAAKEQERKEKQEKRDAEKKAKEDEKRAQEEAKAKKERAQMRLTGFFAKPKEEPQSSPAGSRRGSVSSLPALEESPRKSPMKLKNKAFLPFEPPSHSIIAPYNRYIRDGPAMEHAVHRLEKSLNPEPSDELEIVSEKRSLAQMFDRPFKRVRYSTPTTVKSLVTQMRGSESQPIDLTSAPTSQTQNPREAIRHIRVKSFKYKEDVRPPYIGTYTKMPTECSFKQLARKPFKIASSKVSYDYDSEAEWEEPEEGEDLVSEGEEEAEDDDGEDMDGFLDDDGAEGGPKRQQLLGDMEPVFTTIHWEPSKRTPNSDTVSFGKTTLDLNAFRIETLVEQPLYSIDPFSTVYWGGTDAPTDPLTSNRTAATDQNGMPPPPRVPLNAVPGATNLLPGQGHPLSGTGGKSATAAGGGAAGTKAKAGKPPSAPFPAEHLDDFKSTIAGNKLTKIGLIEVLKVKFPAVAKNTLQETLEQLADRVGAKASEKQWVLRT